jgi:hypothetical protein
MLTDEQLDRVITLRDCQAVKFCMTGAKEHASKHGLDFHKLVREGITVREALALDDALFEMLVQHVIKEG